MLVNKAAPVPSMSRCIIYPYLLTLCASTRITWPLSSRSLTCRGAGAAAHSVPGRCRSTGDISGHLRDWDSCGRRGCGSRCDLGSVTPACVRGGPCGGHGLCSRRRRQLERSSRSAAKNRNLSWDGAAGGRWCPRTDWRMDGSGRSGIMEAPERSARVITRTGGSPWAYFLKRLLSRRTL